ncbi:TetR/AcrR family transcriptional regulator [Streptomyces brasiliensis]|uniref:TetR family transcriptional regulator n=1 Tax=Streptomyces brasiliensis TaxID=1954 RepID=A0A917KFV3_9ACTN|nr:TetR/AcrR family transcriptional regulator [Streptomyces brasiliensis]GGJ12083.1 TetR family transcriptional regulator [Streptomyces brasiliensis]
MGKPSNKADVTYTAKRTARRGTRERLLAAASELLARDGRDAVSTRAVASAAGMQPPTIYRLFGDKEGLLDAVASYGFRSYLADKHALGETDDLLEDLRRGWDLHVEFGLSMPAFYTLMYGEARENGSPAGREAFGMLRHQIARVGDAGRLRMSVDRASRLMYATGIGVVLSQIALPPAERDPELPDVAREFVLRAITAEGDAGPATPAGVANRAVALREALGNGEPTGLTAGEGALLSEWLDRMANAG